MTGTADELQKLADLKAKGVLTEKEFEAQKAQLLGAKAPRKKWPLWVRIPLFLLAIFFLISGLGEIFATPELADNGLPKCESAAAMNDLKAAIDNSPRGRTYGYEIVSIEKAQQVRLEPDILVCGAVVTLNDGSVNVWDYVFRKTDAASGKYIVTAAPRP